VELAVTCLAIRDGFVPPTLNLTDPDPACDLDATPLVGRPRSIRAALKLSIGFGGHLACAVLTRIESGQTRGAVTFASSDAAMVNSQDRDPRKTGAADAREIEPPRGWQWEQQ
jgi:hypothetical protein